MTNIKIIIKTINKNCEDTTLKCGLGERLIGLKNLISAYHVLHPEIHKQTLFFNGKKLNRDDIAIGYIFYPHIQDESELNLERHDHKVIIDLIIENFTIVLKNYVTE